MYVFTLKIIVWTHFMDFFIVTLTSFFKRWFIVPWIFSKSINTNSFCKPSHFFEKVLYFKLIVYLESRYQKEVHQLFSNVKSNITQNKKIIKDFTSYSLVDLVFENLEELSNPKIVKVGPYLKIIWNGIINYLNKNMIIE